MAQPDGIVIGSGPNGLAGAIALAQAGWKVTVYEAESTIGGGVRSAQLTLPGFVHDVCSAVHATAVASPFLRTLPLEKYGLEWIQPSAMVAHPFDDGTAAVVERSIERTAARLGRDEQAYARLFGNLARSWPQIESSVLGPLRWPRHPFALAEFGLRALRSADALAKSIFVDDRTRALFGGIAAHGMVPLDRPLTAGFGLVLGGMAHIVGWVIPRGGAQKLTDALVAHLRTLGGEVVADHRVTSLDELPPARAVLCDLSPRPLLRIAGARFRVVPAQPRAISVRDGCLQSRLGTRRADSMASGRVCACIHRPRVRGRGGTGAVGTGRVVGRRLGAAVRAPCSRHSLIRRVRRREAHGVGLLSRAERLDGRHAATHRSADRALRARVPRPRPGALGHVARRHRSAQCAIWSAAISDRESSTCASSSPGRRGAPTRRRCAASISAPRRRRQVSASTACADTSRRSARSPMRRPMTLSALSTDPTS